MINIENETRVLLFWIEESSCYMWCIGLTPFIP